MSYDPNKKPEDAIDFFQKHLGIYDAKYEIHDNSLAA